MLLKSCFSNSWSAEQEAQMAEAPGGAKGSYMRDVDAMRAQMASMPQLSKKKQPQKADIEDLRYPPRKGMISAYSLQDDIRNILHSITC